MVIIEDNLVNGILDLEDAKDYAYSKYESNLFSARRAEKSGDMHHAAKHLNEAMLWSEEMTLLGRLGYTEDGKLQFKTKEQFLPEIEEALRLEERDSEIYKYRQLYAAVSKEDYTDEEYANFTRFTHDFRLE